ncbi:MAG: HPr-rel-A system PqqD family peptide chaperone [Accumulibacter sp.]|uniref:HPr-rel-A system PqqD family peptide chaperone n=1 Tax=Accumulibacter sp. TaxID=2053492 RepID=UPI002FC31B87
MTDIAYRRLGDGGVVFDSKSWQTHILTPAAAIIFEALAEINEGEPVPQAQALDFLRDELDVDIDTPEMKEVLRSLEEMGILGG